MKNESLLQNTIKKKLNDLDRSFFFKVHGGPMQMAGISDLVGIYKGRFVAIEIKTPENKKGATKLQQWFIKKVNHCGGIGFVARSSEEVFEKMEVLI